MPSTRPVRPTRNVTVPSRSKLVSSSREVNSRRIRAAQALPARASGTLNQNTQCQEMATSAPPSTGPITSPTAATIVFVPIASPSCSRGKASVTIAAALANRTRPPIPWMMRHRIARSVAGESGAQRGQREQHEAADEGLLSPELVGQPPRRPARAPSRRSCAQGSPTRARADSYAGSARGSGSAMISVPELIVARSIPRLVQDSAHHL